MEHRIPGDQLAILQAVTEESRDGVIVFDAQGRVLHQNTAARRLLLESSEELRDTIRNVCVATLRLSERTESHLNGFGFAAAPLSTIAGGGRIGLLTIWPRVHSPTCAELRQSFGLTAREAEVAALLMERRTDAEIAQALGISWHTVRSHVDSIFIALKCRSRREAGEILRNGG